MHERTHGRSPVESFRRRGVQRRIRKQFKKLFEHIEGQADPEQLDQLSRYTGKIKSMYRGWRCAEQSTLRKSNWWVILPK